MPQWLELRKNSTDVQFQRIETETLLRENKQKKLVGEKSRYFKHKDHN